PPVRDPPLRHPHPCPTRRSSDLGAQLFPVVGRTADRDRARAVEAVAERRIAAGDAVDGELDQLLTEDGDDARERADPAQAAGREDWKSTRLNSSHVKSSYAVFCL